MGITDLSTHVGFATSTATMTLQVYVIVLSGVLWIVDTNVSATALFPLFTQTSIFSRTVFLARDAQAKLALIVAQIYLSVRLSVCPSVCLSATACHAYVRSIARREPPRLPACTLRFKLIIQEKPF